MVIVYDFYETKTVVSNLKQYTRSKGSNQIQMNPTIISKIIFGIASIMKKVHQKNILLPDFDLDCFCFDENFEPHLFQLHDASTLQNDGIYNPLFLNLKIHEYLIIQELWFDNLYLPPELKELNQLNKYSDVFSYGILLYKIFSDVELFDNNNNSKNPYFRIKYISEGARPIKTQNIPDHYWNLIQKCWAQDPFERPSFEEIVEILKSDKFAINHFKTKTNLDELHEYQERVDS